MTTRAYDVIVIGGGPAGALAAHGLARRGRSVHVVERTKTPRAKVCGSCLSATGLGVLKRAGLAHVTESTPVLRNVELCLNGRITRIAMPAAGRVVARNVFDAALLDAAETAGARVERGAHGTPVGSGRVDVVTPEGRRTVSAHAVIDARGLGAVNHGRATRTGRIGVGAVAQRSRAPLGDGLVTMTCARGGYVGVVALGDGQLDVAGALDARHLRAHGEIASAVRAIFRDAGVAPPVDCDALTWNGTPPLTRHPVSVASSHERLLRVGDAGGYIEPFTGEGIAWALLGAEAVTSCADTWIEEGDAFDAAAVWSRTHRSLLRARHRRCATIARLLRSPLATQLAVSLVARWPRLARLAVGAPT